MNQRTDLTEAVAEKLNNVTTVLLKKWAGLSGFYGFKAMDLNEVLALLNTQGWKATIDDSAASSRVVELYQGDTRVRKQRFTIDEAGRVHKV